MPDLQTLLNAYLIAIAIGMLTMVEANPLLLEPLVVLAIAADGVVR